MKITTVLSTAIVFLLPGAIVPAYAQEHEQEKQPEQKQQASKPAQHQQQAKPAQSRRQQAQRPATAKLKPAQQPQQPRKLRQQAKPAQQRNSRPATGQPGTAAGGHGNIPEAKFRASFGSGHTFHVNRSEFANGSGRFQYGGYWFNVVDPWPVGWLYTDSVYVDYLNGGYFLCDPVHPGVYISINIG